MSAITADVGLSGKLSMRVRRRGRWDFLPWFGLDPGVALWRLRNLPNVLRGLWRILVARTLGVPFYYGTLRLSLVSRDGRRVDYGVASMRVVTTAGVNFIVDAFQNLKEPENMKYHGFGTGTNAEATSDTALQTELTTEYATDNTRPTGTTTEGSSANIYETVATLTPDASVTITEHGIFDQAANSGGTLLDRSKFTGIALNGTGDSLQATYDLTFTAGS